MKSSKAHQQASAKVESESGGAGSEKISHEQLKQYEHDLLEHMEQLQGKLKVVSNNEKREIKVQARVPGAVSKEKAKLQALKERAMEVEKNPKSVIKSTTVKKKKSRKLGAGKPRTAATEDADGDDNDL